MNVVEDYIAALPDNEKAIAAFLRHIILETSPKFTEKLSYGVPYFFIYSRVCFIWPASSPYAIHKEGVQLGFCKGNSLSNVQGVLDMGKRKEVAIVNFTHTIQIQEDIVSEILFEAIEIDELAFSEKKNKRKA